MTDRQVASEVWSLMSGLVLDNERRREVAGVTGLSFARVRAVRRIARRPMSMKELATALAVDPPNATTLVADLEALGLARRRPDPDDGRKRVVEATPEGHRVARRADEVMLDPPAGIAALDGPELRTLRDLLAKAART